MYKRQVLKFEGPATLVVSSPIAQFCSSLATGLLKLGTVRIDQAQLHVTSIQVSEPKVCGESIDIKMLSPTVVYSTMTRYDGRKYTCYFSPGEKDFEDLTWQNLCRKYEILTQMELPFSPRYEVEVKSNPRLSVLNYKGTVIKGYMCFQMCIRDRDRLSCVMWLLPFLLRFILFPKIISFLYVERLL